MAFSRAHIRIVWSSLYRMVEYQVVSKAILTIVAFVFSMLARILLASTGRGALTSGDFGFLFTSWQGWCILLIGLMTLMVYVAFDLSGLIMVAEECIAPTGKGVWRIVGEALRSIRRFMNPAGVLVTLFVAILFPILGLFAAISATKRLAVPNFIESAIFDNPFLAVPYIVVLVALTLAALLWIFTIHNMIIGGLTSCQAIRVSPGQMRANFRMLVKRYAIYGLLIVAAVAVIVAIHFALTFVALSVSVAQEKQLLGRYLLLAFSILDNLWGPVSTAFLGCAIVLGVTVAYHDVADGTDEPTQIAGSGSRGRWVPVALAGVLVVAFAGSYPLAANFDALFPAESNVEIVAHRGGGNVGPENSLEGLQAAIALGCSGSEIDVQRTADGHYIINHDSDFSRVAGDDRSPEEMTLEEVKQLRMSWTAPDGKVQQAQVPTLREMLEVSRGNLMLYIELKGHTADRRMADDVVAMVREMGMVDQVGIISLRYDLVDYVSREYPEFDTGLLYFFSFGESAGINVDDLIVEELPATSTATVTAHAVGKRMIVWTVNDEESIHRFLTSDCDAIITDNPDIALEAKRQLERRDDYDRVQDALDWLFT